MTGIQPVEELLPLFGSDWPGVPGIAANARAIAKLDIDEADLPAILAGNARKVYRGLDAP